MKKDFPVKLFVIVSLVALGLFFVLFVYFSHNFNDGSRPENNKQIKAKYFFDTFDATSDPLISGGPRFEDMLKGPIISDLDPSMGFAEAPISIVVFSDFGCYYCNNQEDAFKRLVSKYPREVRFIWKDFPPKDMNSYEWQAAHAARCADEQGMFWQYHDELFKVEESERGNYDFIGLAKNLGLRENTFVECMTDLEIDGIINDNIIEASILDVPGIPFTFINDEEIMGEASFEELDAIIQNKLSEE